MKVSVFVLSTFLCLLDGLHFPLKEDFIYLVLSFLHGFLSPSLLFLVSFKLDFLEFLELAV